MRAITNAIIWVNGGGRNCVHLDTCANVSRTGLRFTTRPLHTNALRCRGTAAFEQAAYQRRQVQDETRDVWLLSLSDAPRTGQCRCKNLHCARSREITAVRWQGDTFVALFTAPERW